MFRLVSVCLIFMIPAFQAGAAEQKSRHFRHGSAHVEICLEAAMEAFAGTVIKVEMTDKQGAHGYARACLEPDHGSGPGGRLCSA